jgi:uncharacterized spore protein YtfJ
MGAKEMLEKVGEVFGSAATVKNVFGDPIKLEGKTVVPVAKVVMGFGSGFGSGRSPNQSSTDVQAEGGGGGGGMRAVPAGALEITASETRFIPFHDSRWLFAAFAGGVVLGMLLARGRPRSQSSK